MYQRKVKRVLDVMVALIVLPFFILLFIVVAPLIWLEDRGSIFYHAKRIGKDCKQINMLKFRTMKMHAPNKLNSDGSTYNAKDDPRVTKIGKLLRETSIDEIPQILNVLRGDMSFVGPRASEYYVLDTYKKDELPKMLVRPGITGYTQAYYRNNLSVREKRLKDAWYAQHISLGLDLKIIFKTISTVVKRENIYTN